MDVEQDDIQDEATLDEAVIRFEAIVNQVRTMADGGVRVQLDLPEDAIPQMAMLAETKRQGIILTFEAKEKSG